MLQRKPTISKIVRKFAHLHICHMSTKIICVEKLRNTTRLWHQSAHQYKKTLGIMTDYEAVICRYSKLAKEDKNSIE